MFNQNHRKIEILNDKVRKYYSTQADFVKFLALRKLLQKFDFISRILTFSKKGLYIEETKIKGVDLSDMVLTNDLIVKIAHILKEVHSIKIPFFLKTILVDEFTKDGKYHPLVIFDKVIKALSLEEGTKYKKFYKLASNLEKQFAELDKSLCLIHSDVSPINLFLENHQIKLIDWDDSRIDLPVIDIYGFFDNFKLNHEQEEVFWQTYSKPTYWTEQLDVFLKMLHRIFNHAPEQVSVIIPTYNRCPFKRVKLNPLYTTVESLLENNREKIIWNIIIGDDCSTDYTFKTYQAIKNDFKKINIIYFKNSEKLKASYTRQKAIEMCPTQLFLMTDDDCLFPKDFISHIYKLYKKIRSLDQNIAVLNIPFADKSFHFNGYIEVEKLGKIKIKDHWVYHNFDKLPKGVSGDFIKVDIFDGIFLAVKEKILLIGGYEDLRDFTIDYAEHISTSWRVLQAEFSIYHALGEKFLVNHLKFGYNDKDAKYKGIPAKYLPILKRSNKIFENSGDRLNYLSTLESLISSFTYFYFCISKKEGIKHIDKELEYLSNFNKVTEEMLNSYEKGVNVALKALEKRKIIDVRTHYINYLEASLTKYKKSKKVLV
ncbi:MAG: glycosyltransferase [Candidatus Daviesbacteria bacterium]|nr:glycosyltransferase [Candidatus Daviesbacteria bacterium]